MNERPICLIVQLLSVVLMLVKFNRKNKSILDSLMLGYNERKMFLNIKIKKWQLSQSQNIQETSLATIYFN